MPEEIALLGFRASPTCNELAVAPSIWIDL